jgi:hypothetical protein
VADEQCALLLRLLLATGGDQQADQRFGRFGIVRRALNPGANVREQLVGREIARDQLGAYLA